MKLRPQILLALCLVVLILPVAMSLRRRGNAHAQLNAARVSLATAAGDTQRVLELRPKQQRIADQKRPEQDVIARVNAALADAGIPTSRFAGQRPSSDSILPRVSGIPGIPGIPGVPGERARGGVQYRRQAVQITLRQLTISELGAFLAAWAASQDLWTPTQIDLSHLRTPTDPARYNATIQISATYVADR